MRRQALGSGTRRITSCLVVIATTGRASAESPPAAPSDAPALTAAEPEAPEEPEVSTPGTSSDDLEGQVAGLIHDTDRIVGSEEAAGWIHDPSSLRNIYPFLLESVCGAEPEARALALDRLRRESREAGDPRRLFRAHGELSGGVEEALRAERRYMALDHAMQGTATDCPFWIRPSSDFRGVQNDRERITLSAELGGMLQLRQTESTWNLGGGGYIRALAGYGFNGDWSVLTGGEFSGAALVVPGGESTELRINYFPAIPVVFRFYDVTWHYDVELGAVGLFDSVNTNFSYGVRAGFATGVTALARDGLRPWAGVAFAVDHYFPGGGRERTDFLRGGLRLGFVWDP